MLSLVIARSVLSIFQFLVFISSILVWVFISDFPASSGRKEAACSAGDLDLILALGRSPGEGNGYPLQYTCLEDSTDRGAWRATVHGFEELDTSAGLTQNLAFISVLLLCYFPFTVEVLEGHNRLVSFNNIWTFVSKQYVHIID